MSYKVLSLERGFQKEVKKLYLKKYKTLKENGSIL